MNAGKCYDTLSIGKEEQPAALQGRCLALQRQSGAWLSNGNDENSRATVKQSEAERGLATAKTLRRLSNGIV